MSFSTPHFPPESELNRLVYQSDGDGIRVIKSSLKG